MAKKPELIVNDLDHDDLDAFNLAVIEWQGAMGRNGWDFREDISYPLDLNEEKSSTPEGCPTIMKLRWVHTPTTPERQGRAANDKRFVPYCPALRVETNDTIYRIDPMAPEPDHLNVDYGLGNRTLRYLASAFTYRLSFHHSFFYDRRYDDICVSLRPGICVANGQFHVIFDSYMVPRLNSMTTNMLGGVNPLMLDVDRWFREIIEERWAWLPSGVLSGIRYELQRAVELTLINQIRMQRSDDIEIDETFDLSRAFWTGTPKRTMSMYDVRHHAHIGNLITSSSQDARRSPPTEHEVAAEVEPLAAVRLTREFRGDPTEIRSSRRVLRLPQVGESKTGGSDA